MEPNALFPTISTGSRLLRSITFFPLYDARLAVVDTCMKDESKIWLVVHPNSMVVGSI
jgi:hypothetical protein